jgi:type IV secretory pathway VirB2 component (pilin)
MRLMRVRSFLSVCTLTWITAAQASAQFGGGGGGLPWEGPMEQFGESITGPVARWGIMIAIVASALALAFTDGSALWRKGLFVVFGGSIAFGAASIVAMLGGS